MSFDNNDETDVNNNEVPSVEETTTKEEDGKLTALDASTEKTDPKENNPKEKAAVEDAVKVKERAKTKAKAVH